MIAAVDVETTGLDPRVHEIVDVAVLILDHELKPHPKIMPFNLRLKPERPESADPRAMMVNKLTLAELINNGVQQSTAADLLEKWFRAIGLPDGKKLIPLAHNYPFDRSFLIEWLGLANFEFIFDYHYRDTCPVSLYLNDRTYFVNDKPPFPKNNLVYVASQLNVKNPAPHTALGDAATCAECYRKMMGKLPVSFGEIK